MAFDIKKYCFAENPLKILGSKNINYDNKGLNLFIVEKGTADIVINGQTITLKSGEFLCLNLPCIIKTNKCTLLGINLTGSIVDKYIKEIGDYIISNTIFVPFIVQYLRHFADDYNLLSENYITTASFDILNILSTNEKKNVISNQIINEAIKYINLNYDRVYGVEELSSSLHISKSHLVREFCKYTGTTPGQYLINVRIEAVKKLLEDSSLSLEDIAQRTGFSGDNYLCKSFKKVTGETPIAYRHRIISAQYLQNQLTFDIL